MKRVLVPVDGSECSLRAVGYLADRRAEGSIPSDLEVHLVNVQPPLSAHVSQFLDHGDLARYHQEESARTMQGARALLDAAGILNKPHAEVGRAAEVIVKLADSLHCDHIVMGTHGRGAFAELLVGSTTLKVVHLASVPVVLVK
jgi:nucleotide-binding universal stress UspA family protein